MSKINLDPPRSLPVSEAPNNMLSKTNECTEPAQAGGYRKRHASMVVDSSVMKKPKPDYAQSAPENCSSQATSNASFATTAIKPTLQSVNEEASQSQSPAPFRLLDLPKDIRLMVYEKIPRRVSHRHIQYDAIWNPKMTAAARELCGDFGMVLVVRSVKVAILASCKMVHDEASSILGRIKENFILQSTPKISCSLPNRLSNHLLDEVVATVKFCTRIVKRSDNFDVRQEELLIKRMVGQNVRHLLLPSDVNNGVFNGQYAQAFLINLSFKAIICLISTKEHIYRAVTKFSMQTARVLAHRHQNSGSRSQIKVVVCGTGKNEDEERVEADAAFEFNIDYGEGFDVVNAGYICAPTYQALSSELFPTLTSLESHPPNADLDAPLQPIDKEIWAQEWLESSARRGN